MPLAQKDNKRREDICLHKTQLCTAMDTCRFVQRGGCKFTHALEELRPIPESWTTIKGHYWEQGKPLPHQDVLDLIEQYAEISSAWELLNGRAT